MSEQAIINAPQRSVLIMAGGTGGHVFPALAVADELRAKGYRIEWLGTGRGIENRVVPAAGYPLHRLSVQGVRGKGPLAKLAAPVRLGYALVQALLLVLSLKPDAVLGMGGFASGPGGIAAWLLRKPLAVHEQNAVAGTTNRWLARVASRRLAAFGGALPGADVDVVGNPLRGAVTRVPGPEERGVGRNRPLRLLVLGGSQGALAINQRMPEALGLLQTDQRPEVWHQCGEAHEQITHDAYEQAGVRARVVPFIDDMADAMAWADLVVARAGALTVSEIAAVGVGSLLVPFPFAIDDHQTRNAEKLVSVHAGRLLPQNELTAQTLAAALRDALNPDRLQSWAAAARAVGQPEATQKVVASIEALIEDKA